MTDLPELIANVYRACGFEVLKVWPFSFQKITIQECGYERDISFWLDKGLDAFVRDIVPTLDARGWEVTIWRRAGKWDADISDVGDRPVYVEIENCDTPVEACFRAAWEALG